MNPHAHPHATPATDPHPAQPYPTTNAPDPHPHADDAHALPPPNVGQDRLVPAAGPRAADLHATPIQWATFVIGTLIPAVVKIGEIEQAMVAGTIDISTGFGQIYAIILSVKAAWPGSFSTVAIAHNIEPHQVADIKAAVEAHRLGDGKLLKKWWPVIQGILAGLGVNLPTLPGLPV